MQHVINNVAKKNKMKYSTTDDYHIRLQVEQEWTIQNSILRVSGLIAQYYLRNRAVSLTQNRLLQRLKLEYGSCSVPPEYQQFTNRHQLVLTNYLVKTLLSSCCSIHQNPIVTFLLATYVAQLSTYVNQFSFLSIPVHFEHNCSKRVSIYF